MRRQVCDGRQRSVGSALKRLRKEYSCVSTHEKHQKRHDRDGRGRLSPLNGQGLSREIVHNSVTS